VTLAGRLREWWDGRAPAGDAGRRWVFLDVETSGLDARRDRLIAVAAVAVHWVPVASVLEPRIAIGDSFEAVLRDEHAPVDKANILVHGIGVGTRRLGVEPRLALTSFEQWAGDAPLVAFHAAFDQAMLGRAMHAVLGRKLGNEWLDLAPLASVLLPDVKAQALDDWLDHFGLRCAARHQAAADTLVTAELFLRLWPILRRQAGAAPALQGARRLAAQKRWLVQ
jgi:DNA polymerase-3 subunit epsilon